MNVFSFRKLTATTLSTPIRTADQQNHPTLLDLTVSLKTEFPFLLIDFVGTSVETPQLDYSLSIPCDR